MEEQEVPIEGLEENIHHAAQHAREKWISGVALSSALLAVCAAIAALLSGHHSNEAMIDEIRSSNQWSYYQAKGVKAGVLSTKMALLSALGKETPKEDAEKLIQYHKDQEEISGKAQEETKSAELHLNRHVVFARAVTMFQIAIAIGAVSALLRRRKYWLASLVFGAAGIVFLAQGLLVG